MNTKERVKLIYKAIEDKKGINQKIIDISGVTVLADYLFIVGGNNKNQVQAIADEIEDKLFKEKIKPGHIEGYSTANWILMDYNDIIINIFNEEDRLFYDLERLWQDGKIIDPKDL